MNEKEKIKEVGLTENTVENNVDQENQRQYRIDDPNYFFGPPVIGRISPEEQIEEIKIFNLESIPEFQKIKLVCENVITITDKHKSKNLNDFKNTFMDILNVEKEIRNDVIDYLPIYYRKDELNDLFNILRDIVINDDKGLQKIEDGIEYLYFMDIENCRKYIYESGFIQLYSHTGLYNTKTKNKYDYKKSKDLLKRIKVLQIKEIKDKETYSFVGMDKTYFIDDKNKNYKLIWNPNKDKTYTENGINYYNEYTTILYQGIDHKKDLSLIYHHIKYYLCSDNEEVYNYFISVVSDLIHNPGRKLPVSIIMNGGGGVGKSFLFDKLFSKLFGDMFGSISNKFPSRFNSILENKLCFLIEEFSHQDNINESNMLKNYISNPVISIERKGMEPYFSQNCIRFFICSNGEWSVRIENNNSSRRYLVCDVLEQKPDNKHFDELSLLIKGDKRRGFEDETVLKETIEQFIFDMSLIDTSVLETDPPETESKKVSQSYSKGIQEKQLEVFFEKVIHENGYYIPDTYNTDGSIKLFDDHDDHEINSYDFWKCFTDYLITRRQQIPNGFSNYGRILSKWFGKGYSQLGTKMVNGKRGRIYTFPKIDVVEDIVLGK